MTDLAGRVIPQARKHEAWGGYGSARSPGPVEQSRWGPREGQVAHTVCAPEKSFN